MNNQESKSAEKPAADFTKTWRYKLGLFLIIIGNLGLVIGPILGLFGAGAGVIGAVVLGCELLALSSIIFLGKEGFKAIKSKIFGAVKASYQTPVSQTRHRIGIILFCTNIITFYTIVVLLWFILDNTSASTPFPIIWGLTFEQQDSLLFWLFLIGEISFLISIYVLGAEWWGRFRNIFVWKGEKS